MKLLPDTHTAAVARLPAVHKDPFDRLLVAQAVVEGVTLPTADARLGASPGPVRVRVGGDLQPCILSH